MTLGSYSILEAALTLERRRQQQQQVTSNPNQSANPLEPVDVVAVVSGIATLQAPPAISVSATPRVDLRIADQSIPNGVVAKVSLYGSSEVARISEEQITPGDVVRFNRIGLSRKHNSRSVNRIFGAQGTGRANEIPAPLEDNTLHFEHNPYDPEPGWRWYKLGRIRTQYKDEQSDHHERMIPIFERKAFLSDGERQSSNFPAEMATAEGRIQELLAWFVSRGMDDGDIPLGLERSNRTSRTNTVASCSTTRSLSPLPCQRRCLAEIQGSSGLLSTVHVRVTHSDSRVLPPSSSVLTSPSKMRRVGAGKSLQQQVIGFATVADESGVVLSFVDPGNRFESLFRTAQNQGKLLMISNVLSKKQSDIYGRPLASEEVVLWPTRTSSASLLHSTSSDGNESAGRLRLSKEFQHVIKTSKSNRPCAGTEEEDTETPQTQRHPSFYKSENEAYVQVESSVIDISINEMSIRECIFNGTPHDLKKIVVSADGKDYLPSVVHLESTGGLLPLEVEKAKTGDKFLACRSVTQTLCGGIAPSELNVSNDDGLKGGLPNNSKTTAVGWKVLRLLRALFREGIPLRWTIDVSHDPPEVIKVSLPRV